ncbi:MAG TPA: hypothetical protein VGR14_16840 [Verrucomicrobiae bacterium]|jgi:hypothetical protein|nr:hypothetical protein [Verrucomicrobiae bacterium]
MPNPSRNTNALDPKVLAALKDECSFIQSQQRGAHRIKLEKDHNILVRFLPARLGPKGLFYARIAKHWLNKLPITCPKLTAKDFGGDLKASCPVCALADELNDAHDKETSDFGWRVRANPQYLTYCLLFEQDGVKKSMDEVINPYEFQLNKSTWQELHRYYVSGGGTSPDSVLDYRTGNDFSAVRTHQGTRLYPLQPAPIFELDQNFDAHIEKLEKALKNPQVKIPTREELEAFAQKVQGEASKLHPRHGGDDDGRPRYRKGLAAGDDDDGDLGPQRPAHHAPEAGDDRQEDGGSVKPKSRFSGEPEPDTEADSATLQEANKEAKNKSPGKLPLTENRARAHAEPVSSPHERDDEDDTLPEDDKDKVPPAESLPARGKAAAEEEDAPTLVERKGGSKVPEAIQARLAKLKSRE